MIVPGINPYFLGLSMVYLWYRIARALARVAVVGVRRQGAEVTRLQEPDDESVDKGRRPRVEKPSLPRRLSLRTIDEDHVAIYISVDEYRNIMKYCRYLKPPRRI